MDRLTFEGNFCDIAMCQETLGGSFCDADGCRQRKIWERLKQYEDTGLSPEEVRSIRTAYDENQVPYMIEATGSEAVHLFNLLQAEAEGRLIVFDGKDANVPTNADRIRAMSDEEMRAFLCSLSDCSVCKWGTWGGCDLKEWLKQPVEGGDRTPEMYIKYRGETPMAYRYGDEEEADLLLHEGGYKTEEEAIKAWERKQENAAD